MPKDDEFITLLTGSQPALYGCILSLLPDRAAAKDILQQTNLTLWRKCEDFEPGTNFMAWASRIARYHVLNHRRKMGRDRLVFDDELFADLCERQEVRASLEDHRAEALRDCLRQLPQGQRALVEERYAEGGSIRDLARARSKSEGSISQTLYRVREALLNCVNHRLLNES